MALCISGSGGTGLYRTIRFFIPKIRFTNYPNNYYTISLYIYRYFRYNYIISEHNRY